jgi:hypothetical protein
MSHSNKSKPEWLDALLGPIQFFAGFAISLSLIAGIGYSATWMTEGRCALCSTPDSSGKSQEENHESELQEPHKDTSDSQKDEGIQSETSPTVSH